MKTKHTPGPWWNESDIIHAKDEHWTEECHSCDHVARAFDVGEPTEANAHLIAAAPELYEALEALISACDEMGVDLGEGAPKEKKMCFAALRKARGES